MIEELKVKGKTCLECKPLLLYWRLGGDLWLQEVECGSSMGCGTSVPSVNP